MSALGGARFPDETPRLTPMSNVCNLSISTDSARDIPIDIIHKYAHEALCAACFENKRTEPKHNGTMPKSPNESSYIYSIESAIVMGQNVWQSFRSKDLRIKERAAPTVS
eukprot:4174475-Amphidinium_carterae.1